MATDKTVIYGLVGLGLLAVAIGVMASGEEKDLRTRAREYFEVDEDCESITFEGSQDEINEFWDETMSPYIDEMYEKAQMLGLKGKATATYILLDLFPSCTWPPEEGVFDAPEHHIVWATLLGQVSNREMATP